jgi:hypothetical protein
MCLNNFFSGVYLDSVVGRECQVLVSGFWSVLMGFGFRYE